MAQASVTSAPDEGRSALVGMVALFCAASVLGFAPIFVKMSELGPQATGFWRLTMALPLLAVWLWVDQRQSKRRKDTDSLAPAPVAWKPIILAGLFFAGDLAFWHTGIKLTTAANATFLSNLTPIIVAVVAYFLFGERITRPFIFAGALALFGALLLSVGNIQFAPERLTGDIFSVLTSLWYAAYLLAVRAARRAGAATVKLMFWSTATAAPILLLVTLAFGEPLLPSSWVGWLPLIGLGVVAHVGGQGGIAFGLGRTPAALATLIILIQPVVAAAAGWILFGEALIAIQWLGAGLVLAGVYAAQRFRPAVPAPAPVSTSAPDNAKP
ncbi:DMT family transporter [Maricaulaceae bacterium EIL42A08]|nr:DMT family transporter [Maricaulaceae bacterium EIL42A08]MCP2679069.1 DMT family transporter [Maricaulaceae bacterium NA33B04]